MLLVVISPFDWLSVEQHQTLTHGRLVGDDEEKEDTILEAATRATQLLVKRLEV